MFKKKRYLYTIEGNTSDSCRERSYPLGYYEILGYGLPAYCVKSPMGISTIPAAMPVN